MYGKKYMGVERSTFVIDPDGRNFSDFPEGQTGEHVPILQQALRRGETQKERSLLRIVSSDACIALRETGMLIITSMGSLKKRRKAKISKHKRRKRMKENRHKKRLRYKS